MSSFGKLKKPTNSSTTASSSSSSSTSFNPLELLNKLRSDGGQDPGAVVHTRGSPMESPLKPSPLLGSSNSEGTIGRNGLEMNSPGEYLTIAEGETNEAFEQRIKHFKVLIIRIFLIIVFCGDVITYHLSYHCIMKLF